MKKHKTSPKFYVVFTVLLGIIIFLNLIVEASESTTVTVTEELIINLAPSGENKSAELEKKYNDFIRDIIIVGIWLVLLGVKLNCWINKKSIPKVLNVIFWLFSIYLFFYIVYLNSIITTPLEFN